MLGEELQCVGYEGSVVLEHSAVAGVGVDLQLGVGKSACHVGGVAAVDHEVVVAVGNEDGLGDDREVVGLAQAGVPDGFESGRCGPASRSFVAVVGSFLESVEVVRCGAFALGGAGEEQEVPGIAERESCFEVGDADDGGHLVDTAATAGAGAGEDHAADEFWCLQRDHLGDAAAERESEQVDLARGPGRG